MGQPMPTFLDPTLGEPGPSMAELVGRFCAFIPTGYDPNALNFEKSAPAAKGAVTFDLVVLDGPQLNYGAAPKATPPRMHATHTVAIPAEFRGQVNSNVNVAGALRDHVNKGVVLGVVEISTVGSKGSKPYNITPLAAGDPRRADAQNYFAGRAAGTIVPNIPTELVNTAPTIAPSQYLPAAQPTMTQPTIGQPQLAVPAAAGLQAAQVAPMAPAAAAQPDMSAFLAWQAQQVAAAQPAPAPAAPAFVPAGFEAAWPHMTEEQRQTVLASIPNQF
jgi:hypothetical protein